MSYGNEKPNDDDGVILIMTVWCILIIASVYRRLSRTLNARAIQVGGTVWCYLFNPALGRTRALINMYLIINSLSYVWTPWEVVQRQSLINMHSIIIIIMYICSIAKNSYKTNSFQREQFINNI